jgi:hypothetical protein
LISVTWASPCMDAQSGTNEAVPEALLRQRLGHRPANAIDELQRGEGSLLIGEQQLQDPHVLVERLQHFFAVRRFAAP